MLDQVRGGDGGGGTMERRSGCYLSLSHFVSMTLIRLTTARRSSMLADEPYRAKNCLLCAQYKGSKEPEMRCSDDDVGEMAGELVTARTCRRVHSFIGKGSHNYAYTLVPLLLCDGQTDERSNWVRR